MGLMLICYRLLMASWMLSHKGVWSSISSSKDEAAIATDLRGVIENAATGGGLLSREAPDCDHHGGRYDPLACWLYRLKLNLPDERIKKGIFSLSVRDMVCTNVTLGSIESKYSPSNASSSLSNHSLSRDNPIIALNLSGVSATCVGKYKSTGMSGTVRAVVVQEESKKPMELALEFISGYWKNNHTKIRLATSVETTTCLVSTLKVPSHNGIKFSGSISARFIELFSGPIAKYVSSTLKKQVCPLFKTKADPILTRAIQKANKYMTNLIPSEQQHYVVEKSPIQKETDDWVDFSRDTPLLTRAFDWVNKIVFDRYLDKGVVVDLLGSLGDTSDALLKGPPCPSDAKDCGYFFRGVNGLVKSLTHGDGVGFQIPDRFHRLKNFTIVVPNYGDANIVIDRIQISGLDSLSKLELLRPSERQNFVSTVISPDLGVNLTATINVTVQSTKDGMFNGDPLQEKFHVTINSTSASVVGNTVLNVDRKSFLQVTMKDLISAISSVRQHHIYTGLSCLLEPLESLMFTDLMADLDLVGIDFIPELNNTMLSRDPLEVDIDKVLNNFLLLFTREYNLLVKDALAGIINGPARRRINHYFLDWKRSLPPISNTSVPGRCSEQHDDRQDVPDYFDFRKWDVLPRLNRFLNKPKTLKTMNSYITCVTHYVSQNWSPYSASKARFGVHGGMDVESSNLRFENFGTVEELDFLKPNPDGRGLFNKINMGTCQQPRHNNATNPTCGQVPKASFTVDVVYPKLNISGQINASISLGDVALAGGTVLYYDSHTLQSLTLSQLLTTEQCASVPASVVDLYNFSTSLGFIALDVSSVVTSSAFGPIHFEFDSSESDQMKSLVVPILSWSSMSAQDLMNAFSGVLLQRARPLCDGSPFHNVSGDSIRDQHKDGDLAMQWNWIFAGVAFLVAQVFIAVVHRWPEEHSDEASNRSELLKPLLPVQDESEAQDGTEFRSIDGEDFERVAPALVFHPAVPDGMRHIIPIVTIGTIYLLMSSNLSTGASVDLQISLSESKTISLPSLFQFSLGNTVREFYHAGIWVLLFLVVVFSGTWPYVKLKTMLFAWSAPSWMMTERKRERLLVTLDALGKFSLVDTYVLVLMVVAFRFHLDVADGTSIDSTTPGLDVFVTPHFGFYGFLLATCASLVIGHIMLFLHRKSTVGTLPASQRKESLSNHEFADKINGRLKRLSLPSRIFVIGAILATFILLSLGATRECFTFRFGGLTGLALGDKSTRSYSMLSLGTAIRQSVEDPASFGVITIEIAYLFYTIVMPFTCLGLLLILFCCPMTVKMQHTVLSMAEIANAWSAVEVFIISIVAALLEISTFADFIIGNKCDFINSVLSEHFGDELRGDDKCFSVHSSVGTQGWILFTGVVLNSFLVSVLLRLLHCAMSERHRREACDEESDALANPKRNHENTLVDLLFRWNVGGVVFIDGPDPMADTPDDGQTFPPRRSASRIWEEWRKVCSWT